EEPDKEERDDRDADVPRNDRHRERRQEVGTLAPEEGAREAAVADDRRQERRRREEERRDREEGRAADPIGAAMRERRETDPHREDGADELVRRDGGREKHRGRGERDASARPEPARRRPGGARAEPRG